MILDIEEIVYDKIKTTYPASLIAQYPDIKFTTKDRDLINPKFPTVYIHLLDGTKEVGTDLSGDAINGAMVMFETQVIDNDTQYRAKSVHNEVVKIMKSMGFTVSQFPSFDNGDSTYRCFARFKRLVGANDVI